MKVLFVSSGNSTIGISPIVKNQLDSLLHEDLKVDSFPIVGNGIIGYLKASFSLRKQIKFERYDIIHAHYSLSGFVATLAGAKPLIVSLMGSDTSSGYLHNVLIRILNKIFWSACIVKSHRMRNAIGIENAFVVPNGVNFNSFYPISKNEAIKKLNYDPIKKHILFAADPDRSEKNYRLANDAINLMQDNDIEVHFLKNISNDDAKWYYCASGVVVLTSQREGSPNVIKEAMACNCPIVVTDVGDVKEVVSRTEGCYLCSFEPEDVANKIKNALKYNKPTKGRDNIQYLRSNIIAERIIKIYKSILSLE